MNNCNIFITLIIHISFLFLFIPLFIFRKNNIILFTIPSSHWIMRLLIQDDSVLRTQVFLALISQLVAFDFVLLVVLLVVLSFTCACLLFLRRGYSNYRILLFKGKRANMCRFCCFFGRRCAFLCVRCLLRLGFLCVRCLLRLGFLFL